MLDKLSFTQGGQGWVVLIALGGPFFYGLGACHLSKYLKGEEPVACATGSMITASFVLLPLSLWTLPDTPFSRLSWLSVASLPVLCTGIVYLIFSRLLPRAAASNTTTVTFSSPPVCVCWGVL